MAKINNRELLQSYVLTTAKYDFSVYEKRILYRIVELNQHLLEGKKLNRDYRMEFTPFGNVEYCLPISLFLKDGDKSNHKEVKKALESLKKKEITYQDEKLWASLSIIANPKINSYDENVVFTVDKMINDVLLNFSRGFNKYEMKIAMQFDSVYSMRFYELLSNQKTPINYSIDALKEMFSLQDKYKLTKDFIKRVIVSAQKELDKCSPYTFRYEPIKTSRKITGIRFIPIFQPQFQDEELKEKQIIKKLSTGWYISKNVEDYLINNFEFTKNELKNNMMLFDVLSKNLRDEQILDFLVGLRENSYNAQNLKGYVIGAIKKKTEELVSKKYNL